MAEKEGGTFGQRVESRQLGRRSAAVAALAGIAPYRPEREDALVFPTDLQVERQTTRPEWFVGVRNHSAVLSSVYRSVGCTVLTAIMLQAEPMQIRPELASTSPSSPAAPRKSNAPPDVARTESTGKSGRCENGVVHAAELDAICETGLAELRSRYPSFADVSGVAFARLLVEKGVLSSAEGGGFEASIPSMADWMARLPADLKVERQALRPECSSSCRTRSAAYSFIVIRLHRSYGDYAKSRTDATSVDCTWTRGFIDKV